MRKISLLLGGFAVAAFFMMNHAYAATVVPLESDVQILSGYYDIELGVGYASAEIVPQFSIDDAAGAITEINKYMDGWAHLRWYLLPVTDYWNGTHYAAAGHWVEGTGWTVALDGGGSLQLFDWDQWNGDGWATADLTYRGSAVPVPGALWLLGSGLIGIVGIRRKIKN